MRSDDRTGLDQVALDHVLNCRSLPTLPAVAVELLQLMRDDTTTLKQIAKLVRSDQGLATRVLRTVNSPLYGLRQPCQSIDRALALLGLSAVKSIVLGFSLMESARGASIGEGFALDAYWKRVIYSAATARQVALMTRAADADDAFTGGLFQDMGMLAMATALGDRYSAPAAGGRHCDLPRKERDAFGFDHATAGAALAQRWRLPEETVECVRRHHEPDSAAAGHRPLVCCVALGSRLACELLASGAERRLTGLTRMCDGWFGPGSVDLPELVRKAAADARSLAIAFDQTIEAPADLEAILAEAHEQFVHHQVSVAQEAAARLEESLTDPLTCAGNRRSFDQALEAAFGEAQETAEALSVIFLDVDHFKPINDTHGHAMGDAVLVELAARVTAALGDAGRLFRYGGEEFAILMPGLTLDQAMSFAEQIRRRVASAPVDPGQAAGESGPVSVTISAGVASHTPAAPFATGSALVRAADEALYAAKRAGRNRVAAASGPAETAPPAPAGAETSETDAALPQTRVLRVLLIEDDSLAAAVIRARLARRAQTHIEWERTHSGAAAHVAACQQGQRPAPDIVLCDLYLDGDELGTDLIRAVRSCDRLAHVPVWAISASDSAADVEACMAAGATAFRSKQTIVGSLSSWVDEVVASAQQAA